jgi:hypothetical protein
VVFGAASHTIDCVIRDLSEGGAKIRLPTAEPLPPEIWLIELRRGLAFKARVAWSDGCDLGLSFSASHDLAQEHSLDFLVMRRLWVERQPR